MQPQAAQTIQQVIDGVIQTAGVIAAVATPITMYLVDSLKKVWTTRFIGLAASVIGFLVSILFGKLFDGVWFGVFNSAVGLVVAVGAPGIFSVVKATATPQSTDASTSSPVVAG